MTHEVDCSQQPSGRKFFVAHFIPAWQVIELEYYENDKAKPQQFKFPIARVRSFE